VAWISDPRKVQPNQIGENHASQKETDALGLNSPRNFNEGERDREPLESATQIVFCCQKGQRASRPAGSVKQWHQVVSKTCSKESKVDMAGTERNGEMIGANRLLLPKAPAPPGLFGFYSGESTRR